MYFAQLGMNSCSSLLIENCSPGGYNWGARKYDPKDVASCLKQAISDWNEDVDEDVDEDDDEWKVDKYAFFVAYMTEEQLVPIRSEYEALGFTVSKGQYAKKTNNVCHVLVAPVATVLKNLGMEG